MKKINTDILTEEVKYLLAAQAEMVVRNTLAKTGTQGYKIKYSIADIIVFFPSISKRSISEWCKKGLIGKKAKNGDYYLTIEELEQYLFGK